MLRKCIDCSSSQPFLKDGPFPAQVKAGSRVLELGCSCYLFAQPGINLWFCCHLMRFRSLATHSCGLQAHPHPLPQGCAPGWRQSCTDRHGSGSQHRHRGGEQVPGSRECSQGHKDFLGKKQVCLRTFLAPGTVEISATGALLLTAGALQLQEGKTQGWCKGVKKTEVTVCF